jgi:hypothetical protein
VKRDRQLKSAQITSFHQKEDTLREKLYEAVLDYCRGVGSEVAAHHVPTRDTKLSDLIQFASDILTRTWQKASLQAARHVTAASLSAPSSSSASASSSSSSSHAMSTPAPHTSYNSHRDRAEHDREAGTESLFFSSKANGSYTATAPMSAGSYSANYSLTQSQLKSSVSSHQNDSGGLQDRLRKAQLSFASLREPVSD